MFVICCFLVCNGFTCNKKTQAVAPVEMEIKDTAVQAPHNAVTDSIMQLICGKWKEIEFKEENGNVAPSYGEVFLDFNCDNTYREIRIAPEGNIMQDIVLGNWVIDAEGRLGSQFGKITSLDFNWDMTNLQNGKLVHAYRGRGGVIYRTYKKTNE